MHLSKHFSPKISPFVVSAIQKSQILISKEQCVCAISFYALECGNGFNNKKNQKNIDDKIYFLNKMMIKFIESYLSNNSSFFLSFKKIKNSSFCIFVGMNLVIQYPINSRF
jgi:hypothetical protein